MLDYMRRNAQSWGVKLLFGLIVVVFVFWGVGSFRSNKAAILATVNDQPIMIREFGRAYDRTLQEMREQQPQFDQEQIKAMDLKNRVFNQLVSSVLLKQKAEQWGMTISPRELRDTIGRITAFQNENKQFDPQRYKAILKANNLTPGQFEQDYAHNILMEKVRSYIEMPAKPDPEEVRDFYNYAQARARAEYIPFEWSAYKDQVEIKPENMKEYYENNKDRFRIPEKMIISYLDFTPDSLAEIRDISDEEIKAYYTEHQKEFSRPEQVKARHILIELPEDADGNAVKEAENKIKEIQAKIASDEDFARLAREYSDGPSASNGGELGWFSRGSMVKPFEEAAFALESGEVSDPVRTRFGLHLIKVEERKEAGTKTLAEAQSQIRENLARQEVAEELPDLIDTALEMLLSSGDLDNVARELDLEVRKTAPFAKSSGPAELNLPQAKTAELFAMSEGEITESPIMVDNGYLLARVEEKIPSRSKKFARVKPEIDSILTREKAMAMAETEAAAVLKKLLSDPEKIPDEFKDRVEQTEEFGRRGFIPGLGLNPDLVAKLFETSVGNWLESPYQISSGYVLARPTGHIQPDKEEFEEQKQFWISAYGRMQQEQYLQAFIQQLKNKAEIELINPEVLKY